MENKNVYVIVLAAVISLLVGAVAGYMIASASSAKEDQPQENMKDSENAAPPSTVPLNELQSRVMDFVNYRLVKPGVSAEVKSVDEMDQFYRFNLTFKQDGTEVAGASIYATKDGKYLILNLIELPEEVESGDTGKTVTPTPTPTTKTETKIDIENEPFKGDENAEIVIVEFSDYACPFCAKFAINTLPKIMENYNVRFVYKDFPLPMHGEVAIKAHEAANCAADQGKYWEYHDILFQRQSEWKDNASKFIDYAKMLNLNVDEFQACLDSGKYREEVMQDVEEGKQLGIRGTPTFFINGERLVGAVPYEKFEEVIKRQLEQK